VVQTIEGSVHTVIKLKQVLFIYHVVIRKIPFLTEGAGQSHFLSNRAHTDSDFLRKCPMNCPPPPAFFYVKSIFKSNPRGFSFGGMD
jgi:hypothetical protein